MIAARCRIISLILKAFVMNIYKWFILGVLTISMYSITEALGVKSWSAPSPKAISRSLEIYGHGYNLRAFSWSCWPNPLLFSNCDAFSCQPKTFDHPRHHKDQVRLYSPHGWPWLCKIKKRCSMPQYHEKRCRTSSGGFFWKSEKNRVIGDSRYIYRIYIYN